jgi:predicted pyridoxine 5'-phosphate oxidase superfamily flavin-nucleotide-binding protein
MPYGFLDALAGPSVQAAQAANGSLERFSNPNVERAFDRFTGAEAAFIAGRDSFYMATVSETGWPYMQHRGGPPGFLKVLDETTLGFADFRGNRQYLSLGNLTADNRAALFLMDYARRARLKILARVEIKALADAPDLAEKLALPGYKATIERALLFHLEAFDWNCPQHITPRYTEAEISAAVAPMRARLAELEAENAALRSQPGDKHGSRTPALAAVHDA